MKKTQAQRQAQTQAHTGRQTEDAAVCAATDEHSDDAIVFEI